MRLAGYRRDGAEGSPTGVPPAGGDECQCSAGEPARGQYAGAREERRDLHG